MRGAVGCHGLGGSGGIAPSLRLCLLCPVGSGRALLAPLPCLARLCARSACSQSCPRAPRCTPEPSCPPQLSPITTRPSASPHRAPGSPTSCLSGSRSSAWWPPMSSRSPSRSSSSRPSAASGSSPSTARWVGRAGPPAPAPPAAGCRGAPQGQGDPLSPQAGQGSSLCGPLQAGLPRVLGTGVAVLLVAGCPPGQSAQHCDTPALPSLLPRSCCRSSSSSRVTTTSLTCSPSSWPSPCWTRSTWGAGWGAARGGTPAVSCWAPCLAGWGPVSALPRGGEGTGHRR